MSSSKDWMRGILQWICTLFVLYVSEAQPLSFSSSGKISDVSLKQEVARAIDRGSQWLMQQQQSGGFWSDQDHPALTSLALVALQRDPEEHHAALKEPLLANAYAYLRSCAQDNGGIYRIEMLQNYNTSVSILALLVRSNEAHDALIRKARRFVIKGQQDYGQQGLIDTPMDGGIGYGSSYTHSDLSNTMHALEALYHSRHLDQDVQRPVGQLDWKAALHFIQQCQQVPESNPASWVSSKTSDRGGFVYFPGNSKAGEHPVENGTVALRSYGSISYAGMLSYIYADLDVSDKRVEAVLAWLNRNYTLEENPGMGLQGLLFYYHTMAKALTLAGLDTLETDQGKSHDWRRDLSVKLMDLQQSEGSWKNVSARWWEGDPVLATSYALLTLEMVYPGL
ncbi:cycloartenol synthase [Verrucomicrobia bacterium]|nr:cycloartenol synthase [Verrucomicrobiota bacterium]MDC0267849.1 cycloartenol synthase [bacterium]